MILARLTGPSQKRKRDVHVISDAVSDAVSDADTSESTPCPVSTLQPVVACSAAQTDRIAQKKRRLNGKSGLWDLLESAAQTPSVISYFRGEYRNLYRLMTYLLSQVRIR